MECVIVSSEDECEAQVKAHRERGLRLACVSNTGLPQGQARLTFLPPEAFKDSEEWQISGGNHVGGLDHLKDLK